MRRLEKVGGFSGKATLLAAGQVYQDDPGAWRKDLAAMVEVTNEVAGACENCHAIYRKYEDRCAQ